MTGAPPFSILDGGAASPVVLSVPHAGRVYPLPLRAALRVPEAALLPLEDRYMDVLALAARGVETTVVQQHARAWIDLNRAENERDPAVDDGADRLPLPLASAKLRSGLGLVPRRASGTGDLWRRKWEAGEIERRIAQDHRPYHAAVAAALSAARARFGTAVLLDLHSMPPLPGKGSARIVLGDRFGRAAAARFVHRLETAVIGHGLRPAVNTPYAGGHILDRHGAPAGGVHAVQIEFDRSLYLDRTLAQPGPGLERTAELLRAMIRAVADEALGGGATLAAE
ncbi:N-formylglutamate amidohydrolase [Sphingomonas aracearum]|uniref:N-formylglutamate amidohydrolase n=1 Tax=Sphingomonas aracearum TaxID=2283317 RepID=A0A369VYK1_9SPHN|nr:N-formylglutamate amidohydrolase [Sphingomonas aracearum]RDE06899.1 N-formylglutamate amidohydrolase [Sphingomonas aracearum]